jgi:hypothetical protein
MLSLAVGDRAALAPSVRASLKALVAGQPLWLAGRWTRRRYSKYMQAWLNHICNACTFSSGTFGAAFQLTLPATDTQRATQAAYNERIAYLFDPTHAFIGTLIEHLELCRTAQRRVAICYVVFKWLDYEGNAYPYNHASILMFDFRHRVQIFYNPDDGLDIVSSSVAFAALPPLLAGWTVASAAQTCEPLVSNSLQKWFESAIHEEEHGMCGLMVALVCWVCVRFQYFNPLKVAKLIKSAFTSEATRATFVLRYISWFDALITDIQQGTAQASRWFPATPDVPCHVVSPTTGRLCSRDGCPPPNNGVASWCAQHRAVIGNLGSPDRRCNAPQQATCRLQGH